MDPNLDTDTETDPLHALDDFPYDRASAAQAAYSSEMTPEQVAAARRLEEGLRRLRFSREWEEKLKNLDRESIDLYNNWWFNKATKPDGSGMTMLASDFYISDPRNNGDLVEQRVVIKYNKLHDFLTFLIMKGRPDLSFALLDKMGSLPGMNYLLSEMGGSNKKSRQRKSNKKSRRRKSNKKSRQRKKSRR
jgi:hypothetical protein